MLTVLISIVSLVGWVLMIASASENRKLKKLLNDAYQNQHSTPIKELVSNFRDFVEGIDGKVSPEIEEALKNLETNEIKKALPSHELNVKNGQHLMMDDKVWKLFTQDYNIEIYDDDRLKVIERWGKKYTYTLGQQQQIIKSLIYSDGRDSLRKYFDKQHNN